MNTINYIQHEHCYKCDKIIGIPNLQNPLSKGIFCECLEPQRSCPTTWTTIQNGTAVISV